MRAGETEWAHALAGGLSVRGAEGSIGQRPIVPGAVEIMMKIPTKIHSSLKLLKDEVKSLQNKTIGRVIKTTFAIL